MRAKEFIAEATPLSLGKVTKYPDRPQKFFDLIAQGHTFQSTQGPVVLSTKTIKDLQPMLQKSNVGDRSLRPMVTLKSGGQIPMSNLYYDDSAFGGKGKSYTGAAANLKPATTFGHQSPEDPTAQITTDLAIKLGAFTAGQIEEKILSNPSLDQQGEAGKAVKDMARQIAAGSRPTIPNLPAPVVGSILNDAFEYLGVMQLVYGTAEFPNSEAFYEHVGSDLKNLVLYFPGTVNHPMADSVAMTNKATDNTIYISSKAGKTGKGAPSSVSALKMSDEMKKMIGKDPAVTFIDLLQQHKKGGMPAWQQPFKAADWIAQNYPKTLGELENFLPFSDELMQWLGQTWANQNQGVPQTLKQIPMPFREIYKLVAKNTQDSNVELFYNIRYFVFLKIREAVNSGKAVPNFSGRMLELLGENYVSLATKAVGKPGTGQFVTTVKWPSRMGGRITFERKDGPSKWASSMTWLLN